MALFSDGGATGDEAPVEGASPGLGKPVGQLGPHRCTIRPQATIREAFNGGRGLVFTGLESLTHLIIVLVIVLLLFGAKRVPELAKGLGAGIREFKKGAEGDGDAELHEASDDREEHTPR